MSDGPPTCGAWSCPSRPESMAPVGDAMCRCSGPAILDACLYWRKRAEAAEAAAAFESHLRSAFGALQ